MRCPVLGQRTVLSAYALPMRCPYHRSFWHSRARYRPTRSLCHNCTAIAYSATTLGIGLCAWYAMPGTDAAYGATRLLEAKRMELEREEVQQW
eukprot:1819033-Rhodomonas_salina.1